MVAWVIVSAIFVGSKPATCEDIDPLHPASVQTNGKQVRAFLQQNCIRCHGPQKQEADFRLDTLDSRFEIPSDLEKWVEVMDQLNLGQMPPEGEPRPNAKQQHALIEWIVHNIRQARIAPAISGRAVVRRLNKRQYRNTIRDLVGIDVETMVDVEFPEDPPSFGFDTVGSGLSISSTHLRKYLESARQVVDRAIPIGPRPRTKKWHFEIDKAAGNAHYWLTRPDRTGKQIPYARLSTGVNRVRDGFLVVRASSWDNQVRIREFKVFRPGMYRVMVRAAGLVPERRRVVESGLRGNDRKWTKAVADEKSDATKKKLRDYWLTDRRPRVKAHFERDPIYDYGPPRLKVVLNQTRSLGVVDVTASIEQPRVFEFFAYLGSNECTLQVFNGYQIPDQPENFFLQKHDDFARPELLVDWIKVEGPVTEDWPSKSTQLLLGEERDHRSEIERANHLLARFMRRAFRRPVPSNELEPMLKLFRESREGTSFEKAIKVPLIAILASPNFLYLSEPKTNQEQREPVDAYELASRLSYFLWQTMPDEQLFELARTGRIRDSSELVAQVDRMLDDPKANSFIRSFSRQWLGLRDAGAVRPDTRLYPHFDEHLLRSMLAESESFFAHVLREDKEVFQFLKSDFTMVNERLARFYGIPGVKGDSFRSVSINDKIRRGGILTQASVHMVTSNGTRTSPVKRGVWLLENVLGASPPPAPPNAGDIEPSVPGVERATVRQRLEAHRRNVACASCHAKMDPYGFALENYDAIGQWREFEASASDGRIRKGDSKIDNLSKLPDGTDIQGVVELQKHLLARREVFLRCLVNKLMIYGLGRAVSAADRVAIEKILADAKSHGYSVGGLIKGIVSSEPFLTK